jgi:hypothetical protein
VLSGLETESHFKLSHPVVAAAEDAVDAEDRTEETQRGVRQLLETDSGVLALCLMTQ